MSLRLPLALALIGLPAGAYAQTDAAEDVSATRAIVFEGNAAPACVVRTVSATGQRNASLSANGDSAVTVSLSPQGFIDERTGAPRDTGISLLLPIICNSPHHLRVSSGRGALLLDGGAPGTAQFRNRLDFDVRVDWAGQRQSFNTASATSVDLAVPIAATGEAAIEIAIPGGGIPLVAGTYGDSLTILVEASS